MKHDQAHTDAMNKPNKRCLYVRSSWWNISTINDNNTESIAKLENCSICHHFCCCCFFLRKLRNQMHLRLLSPDWMNYDIQYFILFRQSELIFCLFVGIVAMVMAITIGMLTNFMIEYSSMHDIWTIVSA